MTGFTRTVIMLGLLIGGGIGLLCLTSGSSTQQLVATDSRHRDVSKTAAPELTADDIAGSGIEIAISKEIKAASIDVEALKKGYLEAASALDDILAKLEAHGEFVEYVERFHTAARILKEYKIARKGGADALTLRQIALRYANNAIAILEDWESEAFRELRAADELFADFEWEVHLANRRFSTKIETSPTDRVRAYRDAAHLRVRLKIYVGMEVTEALEALRQAGQPMDESVRRKELLKATVVFLEIEAR